MLYKRKQQQHPEGYSSSILCSCIQAALVGVWRRRQFIKPGNSGQASRIIFKPEETLLATSFSTAIWRNWQKVVFILNMTLFEMTDGWVLVGGFKSLKWTSLLKELKKLIENLTHFYLKAELLRLFSSHKNNSETCFPSEQGKLIFEALLKCIAERSCYFMTSSGWCSSLFLPAYSCRLHHLSAYICLWLIVFSSVIIGISMV